MQLDSDKIAEWSRGLFSGKNLELACPMRGLAEKNDVFPRLLRIEKEGTKLPVLQPSRSLA